MVTTTTIPEGYIQDVITPGLDIQQPIHDLVEEAHRLRHEANCLEDKELALLSEALGI